MANETPNSNQEQTEPVDDATLAFLAVVNCHPSEVRDIPLGRRFAPHDGFSEDNLLSLGNIELWFGKHKGLKLKDVPIDYLLWLLRQPELDGKRASGNRRLKRKVTDYIKKLLEAKNRRI